MGQSTVVDIPKNSLRYYSILILASLNATCDLELLQANIEHLRVLLAPDPTGPVAEPIEMVADKVNVASVARVKSLHFGHLIRPDTVTRVPIFRPEPARWVFQVPLQVFHLLLQPPRLPHGIILRLNVAQLVKKNGDRLEGCTVIPSNLHGLLAVREGDFGPFHRRLEALLVCHGPVHVDKVVLEDNERGEVNLLCLVFAQKSVLFACKDPAVPVF